MKQNALFPTTMPCDHPRRIELRNQEGQLVADQCSTCLSLLEVRCRVCDAWVLELARHTRTRHTPPPPPAHSAAAFDRKRKP